MMTPSRLLALALVAGVLLGGTARAQTGPSLRVDMAAHERARVLAAADAFLAEAPITITAFKAEKSAGGLHDYFSQSDYSWPDPAKPDGLPYVNRDGWSNPDTFQQHRWAMVRLSRGVGALGAAFKITGDRKYADAAAAHLRAWFVTPATRMNPSLLYSQAILGSVTGRGVGIIDTIHLIEVAAAIEVMSARGAIAPADALPIKAWFREYLTWLTTSDYGIDERERGNNHGTCWVMQVAAFARLLGDEPQLAFCRARYKTWLLPNQMFTDGSFPLEMRRTKPYGYALFQLDQLATVAQILSTQEDNLWTFTLPDGRSLKKAVDYMYPFIAEKSRWTLPRDVMFFEYWPVRHASLVFAGLAYREAKYIELWKKLPADPVMTEIQRNMPVRYPSLWID
jgi:Alginate lyase